MKSKIWLSCWLVIAASLLVFVGYNVYRVDPYFHYHKPATDKYFYPMNYERGQNDGIMKHFDYDGIITGTSMTQNFRTTEANKLFGCKFAKITYSGGSYKEINDGVKTALKANPNLKIVIRGLDGGNFLAPWNTMKYDHDDYPTYLYDDNPVNDVEYLLNRDVVFSRVYPMVKEKNSDSFVPGITTFDDYSRWQDSFVCGINTACPDGVIVNPSENQIHLSDADKATIEKNVAINITDVADAYPHVDFYYFYTPYSMAKWNAWANDGILYQMLEAEAYITELILPHKNIHLFSFNNREDIVTDMNNYKDAWHYASWVNSLILKWMHDDEYRLTEENYNEYLQKEYELITTYNFDSLNGQEDYEADYYAGALLNKELTGAEPLDVLNTLNVERISGEYDGIQFSVNLDKGYNYMSFYGQKVDDVGHPSVCVYDENGSVIRQFDYSNEDIDTEKHQYVVDLSGIDGNVTIVLNGDCTDNNTDAASPFSYSELTLY